MRTLIVNTAKHAHHAMLAVALVGMLVYLVDGYRGAAYMLPYCMWASFVVAAWCLLGSLLATVKDDRVLLRVSGLGMLFPALIYLSAYLHPSDELARWM